MKILLVNKECTMGGVETLMIALASALKSHGHQCEIFFFNHGPMEQYLPADGAVHFGDLTDCLKLIKSRGFDVVHANSTDWHTGIAAVRGVGAKLVLTSHGRTALTWTSANCDAFTSCCKWQARDQQAVTDVFIHEVLNGINIDKFKPGDKAVSASSPIVAWVGRGTDVEQKRIDKLAAIAPALHNAGVRLQLVESYGPQQVAEVLPDAARALLPIAEFWGALPMEQMPDFFRQVAASGGCVISTSSFEGLPLTLLEAQACGCPVIAPDVRGVNECVAPEHGGLLYPFEMEPEQLTSLVIDTLRDTERMQWRREESVRHMREQFSMERMAQDYLRIYHKALHPPRKKHLGRLRSWIKLASLLRWAGYVEHCWTVGHHLYQLSERLAKQGEWGLAAVAARTALTISPTLYARPQRLLHLLKTQVRLRPLLKESSEQGNSDAAEKNHLPVKRQCAANLSD